MRARLFTAVLLLAVATGCKHEVEKYSSEPLSEYMPLAVGNAFIYQLDSTVFTRGGSVEEVHHYQEKQEVAEQITDNLGRPSYRINRYLRDSAGTGNWQAVSTFFITTTDKTVEVVENNLRTVRLALPVKLDFSWKGNQYLPNDPYGALYEFTSDTNFDPSTWEFYYLSVGDTLTLNGETYSDVVTVNQVDEETTGSDDQFMSGKTFSEEKYAKGIGLVQQEFIMRERVPGADDNGAYNVGFGVKRTLLSRQ